MTKTIPARHFHTLRPALRRAREYGMSRAFREGYRRRRRWFWPVRQAAWAALDEWDLLDNVAGELTLRAWGDER